MADPIEIIQDDTFFRCDAGRLKLRMFSTTEGELIFYRRSDEKGPRESFYLRSPTSAPEALRESLSLAYGQAGRVRKRRRLFLEGVRESIWISWKGWAISWSWRWFLVTGKVSKAAIAEAYELMALLGVDRSQLIEGAYVDLLSRQIQRTEFPYPEIT